VTFAKGRARTPLRAGDFARKTAIQTDTHLVIVKDGKLTRVPPQALRAMLENGTKKSA